MTTAADLPARTAPFRAGALPGEESVGMAAHAASGALHPATIIPGVVLMGDISEFQPNINDAKYLAWSKAVIIRAAYGDRHDDRAWYGGQRRDLLHAGGARFLGIYQYIIAGQDIVAQANEFCRLIGTPRPGEFYIADIEEGTGNLRQTWLTWKSIIASRLGVQARVYSGLNFGAAHGLAPVDWVAAYGTTEPSTPHLLWQFTSSFTIPGIPGTCDCSVFHGDIDLLASLAFGHPQPAPAPAPVPQPAPPTLNWTDTLVQALPSLTTSSVGEDVRTVQGLLAARGHPVIIDGQYGHDTKGAVTAFQQAKGLPGSGTVDKNTWIKLLHR